MAVTKQDLEYKIAVNTKEAQKNVKDLTRETAQLRDQAGKFATQEQVDLYNSLVRTRGELEKQAEAGKDVGDEYERISGQIDAMGLSAEGAGAGMSELGSTLSTFSKIGSSIEATINTMSSLIQTIETLSDPAKTKRISNLLLLISKFAAFKGFTQISEGTRFASDGLRDFSEALEGSEGALSALGNKIDSLAGFFLGVERVKDFSEDAAIGTTALAIAISAINSGKLPQMGNDLKEIAVISKDVYKDFSLLTKTFVDESKIASKALTVQGTDFGKIAKRVTKASSDSINALSNTYALSVNKARESTTEFMGLFARIGKAANNINLANLLLPIENMFRAVSDKVSGMFRIGFDSAIRQGGIAVSSLGKLKFDVPKFDLGIEKGLLEAEKRLLEFATKMNTNKSLVLVNATNIQTELLDVQNNFIKFTANSRQILSKGKIFDPIVVEFMKLKYLLANFSGAKVFAFEAARGTILTLKAMTKHTLLLSNIFAALNLAIGVTLINAGHHLSGMYLVYVSVHNIVVRNGLYLMKIYFPFLSRKLAPVFDLIGQSIKNMGASLLRIKDIAVSSLSGLGSSITTNLAKGFDLASDSVTRFRVIYQNMAAATGGFVGIGQRVTATLKILSSQLDFSGLLESTKRVFSGISGAAIAGISGLTKGVYASLLKLPSAFATVGKEIAKVFVLSDISSKFNAALSGIGATLAAFGKRATEYLSLSALPARIDSLSKNLSRLSVPMASLLASAKEIGIGIPAAFGKVGGALAAVGRGGSDVTKLLAGFTKPHAVPALLQIAEASAVANAGFVALGAILLGTDSILAKVSGALLIAAGVLLGGFAYAIRTALGYLGSFFQMIGDYLITTMTQFEEKFQKAEVATLNFAFTIAGMSREFGTASGTLASWNSLVEEMSSATLVSKTDAEKMAAEVMSVGYGLGLTKNQMEDFLRVIPNYIKAGDDAFDVTVSFLQALGGAPQGVLKYAVHLSEAAVEHSEFASSLGLSMGAMSEAQKVQARYNTLMEQAKPIMGRAAMQLNTVAGSQQFLNKTLDQAQQKIGKQTVFISLMNLTIAKVTTALLSLPTPIYDLIGIVMDALGVMSKVAGVLLTWAFPITLLTTMFAIFSTAVATNATVQGILSFVLTVTNKSLGGQAIAVTSLGTLWMGFAAVLKGVVVTAVASLGTVVTGLAVKIWTLTTALLANPLFWKAAAWAAAIYLVWKAFEKLEEKTHIFGDALQSITQPFIRLGQYFNSTGEGASILSRVFTFVLNKAIDATVFAVSALVSGVLTLSAVLLKLADIATFGIFDSLSEGVTTATDSVAKLSVVMGESLANLTNFSETAYAQEFTNIGAGAKEAQEALAKLSTELVTATEKKLAYAQAGGKQTEVLLLTKQLTEEKLAIAKEIEERKTLSRELLRINADIAQLPKSTIEDAQKSWNALQMATYEGMESIIGIRKAGALKAQEALKPMQEKLDEINLLPATDDTKEAAQELQKLMASTQESINRDMLKKIDELNKSRLDKELDLKIELAKLRDDELAQINANAEKQIAGISKTLSPDKYKEMYSLIVAAKDKQLVELAKKEKQAQADANLSYANALNEQATIAKLEQQKRVQEYQDLVDKKLLTEQQFINAVAGLQKQATDKQLMEQLDASLTYVNTIKDQTAIVKLEQQKQIREYQVLLDKKLISEEQLAKAIEAIQKQGIDKRLSLEKDAYMTYASATKNETLVAELEYSNQIKAYQELLDKKLIDYRQFLEMQKQAEKDLETRKTEVALKGANKAVEAVSGGISGVVSAVGSAFGPWGVLISGIVNLLNRSPEEMKVFVEGLIKAANALPTIIIKNIPVIIRAIIKELPNSLRSVMSAISSLFKDLLFNKQFWMDVINGLIDVLISTFKDLGDWLFGDMDFSSVGDGIADAVGSGIKSITGATSGMFSVDDMGGAFKARADALGETIRAAGETVKNWLGQAWEGLKQAGRWLDANVWQPVISKLWEWGRWLDSNVWQPVINKLTEWGRWLDTNIWQPVISGLKAAFIEFPLWLLNGLREGLGWVAEKLITNLLEPLGKGLMSILNGIFSGDYFKKIWDGFIKGGSAILEFFGNLGGMIIDGFKAGIKKIGNVLDGLFHFPKMDRGDGVVEKFIGLEFPFLEFAQGGKVPGVARVGGDSPKNDTIPAMLSPDEIVIPRSATLRGVDGIVAFLEKMGEIKPDKRGIGGLNLYSWDDFKNDTSIVTGQIGGAASSAWDGVKVGAGAVWEGAKDTADWVKDAIVKLPADALAAANAILKLGGNIDWVALVKNPLGHIKDLVQKLSLGLIEAPVKALSNVSRFSTGGLVGGNGIGDTVPAMLTPGEFVMNRRATANIGMPTLAAMNMGITGGKANGETTQNVDINLTINSTQPVDATLIKSRVLPVILDELRRASLDGRRVLSTAGVR